MNKGRFLIEAHLRTGRPIGELAAAHKVIRSRLYKLLNRYHLEGPAGLEAWSRRLNIPHSYRRSLTGTRSSVCARSCSRRAMTPGPTIRLTHGDPGATTLAVTRTQSLVWPQLD